MPWTAQPGSNTKVETTMRTIIIHLLVTVLATASAAVAQAEAVTLRTEVPAGRYSSVVVTWKAIGSGRYVDEIGESPRYAKNKEASFGEYVVKWERTRTAANSVLYSESPCIEFVDADGFVVATVDHCENPEGGQQITQTKYAAHDVRAIPHFRSECAPGYSPAVGSATCIPEVYAAETRDVTPVQEVARIRPALKAVLALVASGVVMFLVLSSN